MLLATNHELLDSFRRGDRDALAEVYREYAPSVAAFLSGGFSFRSNGRTMRFSGYGQPFDLEGCLQETFLRAFADGARQRYDGQTPYRRYLLTIARNLALDLCRQRAPLSAAGHDGARGLEAWERTTGRAMRSSATESWLIHRELLRLYDQFVQQLERDGRDYFALRFEEQLPRAEAAERCGMSLMQARTRETTLKRQFLRFMRRHGYFDGYREAPALRPRAAPLRVPVPA